jgi:hypothetical protein
MCVALDQQFYKLMQIGEFQLHLIKTNIFSEVDTIIIMDVINHKKVDIEIPFRIGISNKMFINS